MYILYKYTAYINTTLNHFLYAREISKKLMT